MSQKINLHESDESEISDIESDLEDEFQKYQIDSELLFDNVNIDLNEGIQVECQDFTEEELLENLTEEETAEFTAKLSILNRARSHDLHQLYISIAEDFKNQNKVKLMARTFQILLSFPLDSNISKSQILYQLSYYYQFDSPNFEKMKYYYHKLFLISTSSDYLLNLIKYYYFEEKNYMKFLELSKYLIIKLKNFSSEICFLLGFYYQKIEFHPDKMKSFYILAIKNGDLCKSYYNIAEYYSQVEIDERKMKFFYKKMIKELSSKDSSHEIKICHALNNLGSFYMKNKHNKLGLKYLKLSAKEGHVISIFNLAKFYQFSEVNEEMMMKYHMKLIEEHTLVDSMYYLGYYFKEKQDEKNMKKYLYMAAKFNHEDSMNHVLNYYSEQTSRETNNYKSFFIVYKDLKDILDQETLSETLSEPHLITDYMSAFNVTTPPKLPPLSLIQKVIKDLETPSTIAYLNLVRTFERLNIKADCPVCLEDQLSLILPCGHGICPSCYTLVYKCPYCNFAF